MATTDTPRQAQGVIAVSDRMKAGSYELQWYNKMPHFDTDFFKGKKPREHRTRQHGTVTLNLFQRFTETIYCGLRASERETDRIISLNSEKGMILSFVIGGGTEIPHFCLRLRLTTNDAKNPEHDCILLWSAWDAEESQSRRRPKTTPLDGEEFTFSAALTKASIRKVKLTERSARACLGTVGGEGYEVQWTSNTLPQMTSGLDIPESEEANLFAEPQLTAFRKFKDLHRDSLCFLVITRVRRPWIEENGRALTSMPCPTLAPYPFYGCNYVPRAQVFQAIKEIPPIDNITIHKHHQHREWGWLSRPDAGFEKKPNLYWQITDPFTFFINEREYEVLRMIAILRERDAAKDRSSQQWNGNYTFDIFQASHVHNFRERELDQYYYGFIEGAERMKGSGAVLEALEQDTPLPEPGTLISIKVQGKNKSALWEGVVVLSQGITRILGKYKPSNPIFFRLKRPAIHGQMGLTLNLSGYVWFAPRNPSIAQARRAIRSAMWGNNTASIPRNNKMKRLLLAQNNGTIRYHRRTDETDPQTLQSIDRMAQSQTLNKMQIEAVRSAFSGGTAWNKFLCIISGPPGTGKTSVSLAIAAHCIQRKWPVLIVCASDHQLDAISKRVHHHLNEKATSHDKIYRLGTGSLESPGMPRPSTSSTFEEDEEDRAADIADVAQISQFATDLRERGLTNLLWLMVISSVESMVEPSQLYSLTGHILDSLKSLFSGKQSFYTSTKKQNYLWEFVACQELLLRHSRPSAQSGAVATGSRPTNPDSTTFGLSVAMLTAQQKALWLQLQELYLEDARLVFCTASTAGRKALRRFQPSYLIVEGASQMVESQTLNAIMPNYSSLKKVVLTGDLAQLAPTVLSVGNSECSNLEQVSFFERMIKTGYPYIQLNLQYRMAPDIGTFVSDAFYDSHLSTHPSCVNRPRAQTFSREIVRLFNCEPGYSFFLSVNKSSLWRRKGLKSILNPEYIDQICSLVDELWKAGVEEKDILVLSYYSEERRALSSLIQNYLGLHSVGIKSVDASQGSESAYVILSTTRPGGASGLSFLHNKNRQCVALSRAQDGLIIVGDEHMGDGNMGAGYKIWNELIQSHASANRLIRVDGDREQVVNRMGITKEEWEQVE